MQSSIDFTLDLWYTIGVERNKEFQTERLVHNMNEEKIISTIKMLAMSQGSYGRLYNQLMAAKNAGSAAYDSFINEASEHCSDAVSLVMWIEG